MCAAFITQPEIIVHPAFNAAKEVGKTLIESIADLLKDTGKSAAKGAFDALTNPQSFGGGLLTFIVIVSLGLGGLWMILGCFRKKNNSEDKKSCLKITNPA